MLTNFHQNTSAKRRIFAKPTRNIPKFPARESSSSPWVAKWPRTLHSPECYFAAFPAAFMHATHFPSKQSPKIFLNCNRKPQEPLHAPSARKCSSSLAAMRTRKPVFLSAPFQNIFKRLHALFGFDPNSGKRRFFAEFRENASNFSNSPLWHARLLLSTFLRNQSSIVNS